MSVQDQALLRAISEDRALGSAMLFAHRHEFSSPEFHVEIMDAWRAADPYVLIEAFREGAKTTLAEEFLLMEGAYGNFRYTVIFGETYTKACQKLEAIAYEARTNVKVRKLFGNILAKKPIENRIYFTSGSMIECAGWEQEVTGFKYHEARPDRFYLDDVENEERVRDTAAVDATLRKLYKEIIPAGDKKRLKVRVTETPRAADCVVTRLRNNPDWVCRSFPIVKPGRDLDDPLAESMWKEKFPIEWIRERRDQFERVGMLRQFQQEYLLNVDTGESKPFSKDMIAYTDLTPQSWLPRVAIYDPARTANRASSCAYGKVVVSRLGSKLIVHESSANYWKPDEARADLFDTWKKHACAQIGIEKDSLDEYLLQPIRYESLRRGVVLPLKPLNAPHDRDKQDFIMGLQPFFKAGDIVLVGGPGMHRDLVAAIENFPGGKIDALNALAYALRMFAGDLIYQDFGEANIVPSPKVEPNAKLACCWNASSTEAVCAVLERHGRHTVVLRDFASGGPLSDAVRQVKAEIEYTFPRARLEHWAPAELHDQMARIPLVPALRDAGFTPWRAEHYAIARGAALDGIRTELRGRRCLTVSREATLTLNALACGYKYPVGASGQAAHEPETGLSRLVAEAIECALAAIARGFDSEGKSGAHFAHNAQGARYMTALPQRR